MRTDLFDFDLPEDRIALRPARPRDVARLMLVRQDASREKWLVCDLPDLLRPGDVLVVNDTRVIPVRLMGRRAGRKDSEPGAEIEVTLIARTAPNAWRAFARPAKRLKKSDTVVLGDDLVAQVGSRAGGEIDLTFDRAGAALDAAIAAQGSMPLPPYIAGKREPDERDVEDYQTVFARRDGSIAAPTAALHFTPMLLARLEQAGIERRSLTLHVGPGTFLPVTEEDTAKHRLQAEHAVLDVSTASALNRARAEGRRIVAVGTTVLRTLESASDEGGVFEPFNGETELFITPGYRFKTVDVLMTNFHLPRSTLFMLVCAFAGIDAMKAAYAEAIANNFRFYSYGDACLLFRASA